MCKPDKGNSVVILNRTDYHQRMMDILKDRSKFVKRDGNSFGKAKNKNITIFREEQLQRYVYSLKTKGVLDEDIYKKIYPKGSIPARMYGLPKMHKVKDKSSKVVPPHRPIVSSIGSFNYNLARYLAEVLSPHIPSNYSAKDTFSFVEELKEVRLQNKYLVSFDVVSLFTNIPLHETVNLAVNTLIANEPSIKMSKAQLEKLFLFATSQTHFMYNDEYYDQVDGVAMGSPLGPVLANLFMGVHENKWLGDYNGPPVLFYKRYVDDIFCMFETKEDAHSFLDYLNSKHRNIKFTIEGEENGKLPNLVPRAIYFT